MMAIEEKVQKLGGLFHQVAMLSQDLHKDLAAYEDQSRRVDAKAQEERDLDTRLTAKREELARLESVETKRVDGIIKAKHAELGKLEKSKQEIETAIVALKERLKL